MLDQPAFEVAFHGVLAEREEIEIVRVFEDLRCQLGLRRGQRPVEVVRCPALVLVQARTDSRFEHGARPAVLDAGTKVSFALLERIQLAEQAHLVTPRQLYNKLSHKFLVPIRFRQRLHVHQVASGKPVHIWSLPAGVAARIKGSSGIGSLDLRGDFQRDGEQYVSSEFDTV